MKHRNVPIPADFVENAALHRGVLAARYGVSEALITRWRQRCGIHIPRGKLPSKPPAEFAAVASLLSVRQLKHKFGICGETARKWRKICGAGIKSPGHVKRPVPDDFATIAATTPNIQLCAHYGTRLRTIHRWREETGIPLPPRQQLVRYQKAPKARVFVPGVKGRVVLPGAKGYLPPPLAGREQEAAQFLRRHYSIVCRCNAEGQADQRGKFWRCGAIVLEPASMVAKAQAKGFDPDAWQRVA